MCLSFGGSRRRFTCVLSLADGIQPLLQCEFVDGTDRKANKNRDTIVEHAECLRKGKADFGLVASSCSRIGNAPMRRHRLTRPHWAYLLCRVVADRENKIKLRGLRARELRPTLRATSADVVIQLAQEIDGIGMDMALRMASRREGTEFPM